MMSTAELRSYPEAEGLAQGTAEYIIGLASDAIASRGWFSVALSGGSTPRALYSLLAEDSFRVRLDWSRVHVFWGDERCVSPDHPESNYRMVRETLLDHVPVPGGNVYRIRGEMEPEQAAAEYEQTLYTFFTSQPAKARDERSTGRFDLILLGMGDDGHTASLFPGTAAIHEQSRWVVAHYVENLCAWRVTFTPVIINAAVNVVFVVSGPSKAERLKQVLAGPYQPDIFPAQIVRPSDGQMIWMVDAAAAKLL